MSDESPRGGGGFGAGFVMLIFVGFVVKFWLWILAGIAAVALIGIGGVRSSSSSSRRSRAAPTSNTRGPSPATTAASTATIAHRFTRPGKN
jgi:hypothetical protein